MVHIELVHRIENFGLQRVQNFQMGRMGWWEH